MTYEAFSEEIARSELYGLLSRLWLAPPDADLLAQFAVAVTDAPESGGYLEEPWRVLVGCMREATVESATTEFEALFQSVGKPEVFAFASYYLAGFVNEKPLADLRTDLLALGLTRDPARLETEDHIAYEFEVMRYLIGGEDAGICNLEQQRRFFRTHLQPWVEQLCTAVEDQPLAHLWAAIAAMTRAFVQVEAQAFDLLEA